MKRGTLQGTLGMCCLRQNGNEGLSPGASTHVARRVCWYAHTSSCNASKSKSFFTGAKNSHRNCNYSHQPQLPSSSEMASQAQGVAMETAALDVALG